MVGTPGRMVEMSEQRRAIRETEWDWLIIHDAGRPDTFENLQADLDFVSRGDYQRVDNGGIGFTATWFRHHFPNEYDLLFFHGGQPIHSMQGDQYDEREHFKLVPGMTEYEYVDELATVPPEAVVDVVDEYRGGVVQERLEALGYASETVPERGVIRFLQPHAPFRRLVEETKGRANRVSKTAQLVRSGALDVEDLHDAYADNYRWALEATWPLVDELPGTVVITADHGECLGDCGQFYHSGAHDMHDHLRTVPWLVIDE